MELRDARSVLRRARAAHVSGWVVYKAGDGATDLIRDLASGELISTSDHAKTEAWIHRTFYKESATRPRITHCLLLTGKCGKIALSDGNQIDLQTGEFGPLRLPASPGPERQLP